MEENFSSRREKAFDFAAEVIKQCIGLATAIIALTIGLIGDGLNELSADAQSATATSWWLLLASVLFGILSLGAIAGELDRHGKEPTIKDGYIERFAIVQVVFFFFGMMFLIFSGLAAFGSALSSG